MNEPCGDSSFACTNFGFPAKFVGENDKYANPKTFKTERGCPFLIKINKKESTYNNQKKKSKKEKITCNNPEERKQEKEYQR